MILAKLCQAPLFEAHLPFLTHTSPRYASAKATCHGIIANVKSGAWFPQSQGSLLDRFTDLYEYGLGARRWVFLSRVAHTRADLNGMKRQTLS